MANTTSTTFSVRLKPSIKKRLAKLARASGRSSNFLIADAVESYVADQERMLAEVRQADRQERAGHYIRELVIGGTPYIILYRVRGDRVTIKTIWHNSQRRTWAFD